MKITRTAEQVARAKKAYETAHKGCYKCPCCGETKSDMAYLNEGTINKGISGGVCKSWASGIFRTRYMRVDCYSCGTCGAQWESEPYEVEL